MKVAEINHCGFSLHLKGNQLSEGKKKEQNQSDFAEIFKAEREKQNANKQ